MFLGVLAGVIGIAGYIPYIRDILRGTTKPERASWLIWLLEYTALFIAQVNAGARESLWLIGLQLLGVIIICMLSYRYGTGNFNKQSKVIFACVCATLLLWYFTSNAGLAILLLLTVESVGVVLTIRKVYKQPGSETLIMWILVAAAGLLGVVAVGVSANSILYVYPVALMFMGSSVIAASWLGARRTRKELIGQQIS